MKGRMIKCSNPECHRYAKVSRTIETWECDTRSVKCPFVPTKRTFGQPKGGKKK